MVLDLGACRWEFFFHIIIIIKIIFLLICGSSGVSLKGDMRFLDHLGKALPES